MNEIHDTAGLPLDRLLIDLVVLTVSSRDKFRPPGSNEPIPISPMRRMRDEEFVPRENLRAREKEYAQR